VVVGGAAEPLRNSLIALTASADSDAGRVVHTSLRLWSGCMRPRNDMMFKPKRGVIRRAHYSAALLYERTCWGGAAMIAACRVSPCGGVGLFLLRHPPALRHRA